MRATLTFSAVISFAVIVGASVTLISTGHAADTPNANQIIDSLTPPANGGMATRGIRLGGQPPATGQTGNVAPPEVKPPEANLSVPFASGSAMISPAAARVLDQLGEALASAKLSEFRFRVEGHTDTVGQPDMNKALSQQRASSVTEYLVAKYRIDRARLTPVGMGEDGLLIATGPQVSNAANRRVLVVNLGR